LAVQGEICQQFRPFKYCFQRFRCRLKKIKFAIFFLSLVRNTDFEWGFIDGSFVKAHQYSAGLISIQNRLIGKSADGNNSKIHTLADAFGLSIKCFFNWC
jgi:hypothetical protein